MTTTTTLLRDSVNEFNHNNDESRRGHVMTRQQHQQQLGKKIQLVMNVPPQVGKLTTNGASATALFNNGLAACAGDSMTPLYDDEDALGEEDAEGEEDPDMEEG